MIFYDFRKPGFQDSKIFISFDKSFNPRIKS